MTAPPITPPTLRLPAIGVEALHAAGLADDIDFCEHESRLDAVGRVSGTVLGLASVGDSNATVTRCPALSFSA